MIRTFLIIFKFVFENTPNIGFWIGVLYFLHDWYIQQHILIRVIFLIVPMIAIFVISLRIFKEIKNQLTEVKIETGLKEKRGEKTEDGVRIMKKNLPSKKELVSIYKYASSYAKSWASDGMLEEINYYLDLDGNRITKNVQIYIRSQLKRERLAFYLPRRSQKIEEFSEYGGSSNIRVPPIYSFEHWKKAIEKAIESSTSDIEKSDRTHLQISPSTDSLYINLTFSKGDREWRNRYFLKENALKHKDKVISEFG
jgi:hypothetical protein